MTIQFISMDTQSLKFLLVESNNNNKFAVKLCSIIRHHWNGQSNQLFLLKYFCIETLLGTIQLLHHIFLK